MHIVEFVDSIAKLDKTDLVRSNSFRRIEELILLANSDQS